MQDKSQREPAYGMWVTLAGVGAVTAITIVALIRYDNATSIVTALGPVTAVIGTLIGAYFGLRGSSLAQQNANQAEIQRATAAATVITPNGGPPRTEPPVKDTVNQ
jgi:secreted protein with Ig-like and vWFA domain